MKIEIEKLREERNKYKEMAVSFEQVIRDTQKEIHATKAINELIHKKAESRGIPTEAIEISKAILRSEIEFKELEEKLVADLRFLAFILQFIDLI
jgi:hypothetical protein